MYQSSGGYEISNGKWSDIFFRCEKTRAWYDGGACCGFVRRMHVLFFLKETRNGRNKRQTVSRNIGTRNPVTASINGRCVIRNNHCERRRDSSLNCYLSLLTALDPADVRVQVLCQRCTVRVRVFDISWEWDSNPTLKQHEKFCRRHKATRAVAIIQLIKKIAMHHILVLQKNFDVRTRALSTLQVIDFFVILALLMYHR